MEKETVIFKTYILDINEKKEDREYIFNLNDKIIDIKNKILNDTFNNKFNNLEMVNITERIYKDFGKLFFDKGLLPQTINNYKLTEFTCGGRVFSFLVSATNVEKIVNIKKESNFIKNIIKEDRKKNNEFVFYNDEFPPLS